MKETHKYRITDMNGDSWYEYLSEREVQEYRRLLYTVVRVD